MAGFRGKDGKDSHLSLSETLSSTEGTTLGLDATIASGAVSTTDSGGSHESDCLVETGSETGSDQANSNVFFGEGDLDVLGTSNGGVLNLWLSQTATGTDTQSSNDSATFTLGGAGVTLSGTAISSLSDTSTDSSSYGTSGADTLAMSTSGNATQSSTYGTTLTSTETDQSSSTDTVISTQSDGLNAQVTWGLANITDSSGDQQSDSTSLSGLQTLDFGAGSQVGMTTITATEYSTDTDFATSTQTLGLNATISSGSDQSTLSTTDITSESITQGGSHTQTDAAGGPAFSSALSSNEVATSYNSSVETSNDTVGAGGTITSGTILSQSVARATDDRVIGLPQATDNLGEADHDSFSETMTASESLTTGGTISGGTDSYTWDQNVDNAVVINDQGGGGAAGTTIPGAYRLYYITDADQVIQDFHDVGSDLLGASDSILAGSDSYTWVKDRYDSNTITDYGKSDTADHYTITASSTDNIVDSDVGWSSVSGTLATASDCYTYSEQSSDNAHAEETDTDTTAGDYTAILGTASDFYNDTDIGTIYSAGTFTYTNDSFTLDNDSGLTGGDAFTHADATDIYGAADADGQTSSMHVQGSRGSASQSYTFNELHTQGDRNDGFETYSGTLAPDFAVTNESETWQSTTMVGSVGGLIGESFSMSLCETDFDTDTYAGHYFGGMTGDYGGGAWTSLASIEVATSPPLSIWTTENGSSSFSAYPTSSGGPSGYNNVGAGLSGPGHTGGKLGTGGVGGAVHLGTGIGPIDDSTGLLSALGSGDVEALRVSEPEMSMSIAFDSDDGTYYMQINDGSAAYASTPASIGYRRPVGGLTDTTAPPTTVDGMPGAEMSNGTADGTDEDEEQQLIDGVDGSHERSGPPQARPEPVVGMAPAPPPSSSAIQAAPFFEGSMSGPGFVNTPFTDGDDPSLVFQTLLYREGDEFGGAAGAGNGGDPMDAMIALVGGLNGGGGGFDLPVGGLAPIDLAPGAPVAAVAGNGVVDDNGNPASSAPSGPSQDGGSEACGPYWGGNWNPANWLYAMAYGATSTVQNLADAGKNFEQNFAINKAGSARMAGAGMSEQERLGVFDSPGLQAGSVYNGSGGLTTESMNNSLKAAAEVGGAATTPFRPGLTPGFSAGSRLAKAQGILARGSGVTAGLLPGRTAKKAADKGAYPKSPRGKGSVPPAERDPKRVWTKSEKEAGLAERNGTCDGCGTEIGIDDARGHHRTRHADGGMTDDANLDILCEDCHKEVHRP